MRILPTCTSLLLLISGAAAETVLRAGTATELEPLSPVATSSFWYGSGYTGMVHVPLLTYHPPEARLGPCLAESWEISEDNRAITFHLAAGTRWHDGRDVTAADVTFTLEYIKKHQFLGQLWRFLERTEVVGPRTARIHFNEPVAFYQSMFFPWPKILPRHVWEEIDDPENFQGKAAMIGCGPFSLERYDTDARVAFLRKVPGFSGGDTRIDAIQIRFYGSTEALLMALRRGDIDVIMGTNHHVPLVYVPGLEKEEEIGLVEVEDTGVPLTLVFNADNHPTRIRAFRRAIACAMDSRPLIQALALGRGQVPELGFAPPASWSYGGPFPPLRHDPQQAMALLDSLGFADRDGDGLREDVDGSPFVLEIIPETWQSHGEATRAVEMIIHQLGKVGIRAEMKKYVVEQEYDILWEQRDYQVYVGHATHAGARDGGQVYFANFAGFSYGTFTDSSYLALIDRITHAPDEAAYLEATRQSQAYNARELPGLALIWGRKSYAFRRDRFSGWQPMAGYGIPNYASWFTLEAATRTADAEHGQKKPFWRWSLGLLAGALILVGALLVRRTTRR